MRRLWWISNAEAGWLIAAYCVCRLMWKRSPRRIWEYQNEASGILIARQT